MNDYNYKDYSKGQDYKDYSTRLKEIGKEVRSHKGEGKATELELDSGIKVKVKAIQTSKVKGFFANIASKININKNWGVRYQLSDMSCKQITKKEMADTLLKMDADEKAKISKDAESVLKKYTTGEGNFSINKGIGDNVNIDELIKKYKDNNTTEEQKTSIKISLSEIYKTLSNDDNDLSKAFEAGIYTKDSGGKISLNYTIVNNIVKIKGAIVAPMSTEELISTYNTVKTTENKMKIAEQLSNTYKELSAIENPTAQIKETIGKIEKLIKTECHDILLNGNAAMFGAKKDELAKFIRDDEFPKFVSMDNRSRDEIQKFVLDRGKFGEGTLEERIVTLENGDKVTGYYVKAMMDGDTKKATECDICFIPDSVGQNYDKFIVDTCCYMVDGKTVRSTTNASAKLETLIGRFNAIDYDKALASCGIGDAIGNVTNKFMRTVDTVAVTQNTAKAKINKDDLTKEIEIQVKNLCNGAKGKGFSDEEKAIFDKAAGIIGKEKADAILNAASVKAEPEIKANVEIKEAVIKDGIDIKGVGINTDDIKASLREKMFDPRFNVNNLSRGEKKLHDEILKGMSVQEKSALHYYKLSSKEEEELRIIEEAEEKQIEKNNNDILNGDNAYSYLDNLLNANSKDNPLNISMAASTAISAYRGNSSEEDKEKLKEIKAHAENVLKTINDKFTEIKNAKISQTILYSVSSRVENGIQELKWTIDDIEAALN